MNFQSHSISTAEKASSRDELFCIEEVSYRAKTFIKRRKKVYTVPDSSYLEPKACYKNIKFQMCNRVIQL